MKWYVLSILLIGAMVLCSGCTAPNRYDVKNFNLGVNESVSYNVELQRNALQSIMGLGEEIITNYLYTHTTTTGTYRMDVTTNDVNSKADIRWMSVHRYLVTDDKFGHTHYEPVAKWGSGVQYTCSVDKTRDCGLLMSIEDGVTSPDLQIYITGWGTASMMITRVS